MMGKRNKGDIAYYKPLSICKKGTMLVGYRTEFGTWYDVHTKTRPIAYSTVATYGWLGILRNESNSWEEMLNKANGNSGEYIQDLEAVNVISAYIKCKAPFEDVLFN